MDAYLAWLLLGLALVIVELLTGTFYLLVLGVAAFADLAKQSNTLIVPAKGA
jgi:membrane protein implicated in regulation of membrane protease activity